MELPFILLVEEGLKRDSEVDFLLDCVSNDLLRRMEKIKFKRRDKKWMEAGCFSTFQLL